MLLYSRYKTERRNIMVYDLQRANGFKRISAFLFDIIIFFILVVGLAFLFAFIFGVDARQEELDSYRAEYQQKYKDEYGIDLGKTAQEIEAMPEEERALYEQADSEWVNDNRVAAVTGMLYSLFVLDASLSILLTFLVLEFAVPLLLHNGQTLGKKIFGVGIMRIDGVKITAPVLFVRSILGKCTLETMVPVLIFLLIFIGQAGLLGTVALILVFVLELVLVLTTKNHSMPHDLIANTVAVDLASQMIFESVEDMIEYKKKIHAEAAEKKPY